MLKVNKLPGWAKVLVAATMMCVLGPLSLNMQGYTPVTLQSLGVILFPMIFGWKEGTLGIILYLIIGALGVPVFADFKGGAEWFTSKSGGFLFGFVPVAALAGYAVERTKQQFFHYFLIFLSSHLLLLVLGFTGLALTGSNWSDHWAILKYLTPGMFFKSFLGAILVFAIKIKSGENSAD